MVSTWRTPPRMFLERGLPGKINLRLTSSASRRLCRPHHLTQCSSHRREHHAWVAVRQKGTLFGVPSEGKTKAMTKREEDSCFPPHQPDSLIHKHSSSWPSISFTRAKIKKTVLGIFQRIVLWQLLGYFLCFCLVLSKVLPGEANSSWN